MSKSDVERAHTVFLSGKQYLEESNYDKAISYFKDAYSIDCSIHAILPIIATAYERKGDKAEAVHALEEYQRRSPNAGDHEVIERRIRNLKDQIARDQPAATATPTAAPTATATAIPTASPEPTSTAMAAPTSPSTGETPPSSAGGPGVGPWVVVGIGGAAVVGGIVMFAVGAGDISSAAAKCPTRTCPMGLSSTASQGNTGRTLEDVGGVVAGVGVAAVALGLVWHFVAKPSAAPAAATTLVTPVLAPGYGGLALGGAF